MLMQNKSDALRYVELLTGSPETPVNLRAVKDANGEEARVIHGSIDQRWQEICQLQNEGFGIFAVVNDGGHRDHSITDIRALFVDADNLPMPDRWEWHLKPDWIVRRDEMHWHAYWKTREPISSGENSAQLADTVLPDEFKSAQRRLAEHYGTDRTICNPSRIMRLPGTLHLKDPVHPHLVKLIEMHEPTSHLLGTPKQPLLQGLPETKSSQSSARAARPDANLFNQYNVDRAMEIARTAQPAIEFEGSDAATIALANRLLDWTSPERTVEIMKNEWMPRCKGDWDEEWLELKVGNAATSRESDIGCNALGPGPSRETVEVVRAVVAGSLTVPNGRRLPLPIRFTDALKRDIPPLREIVPDLIERGTVTFLNGVGGSYKSTLGLQIGLCIDAGVPVFGRPVERATFHYLSYEDDADTVDRRAQKIARRFQIEPVSARYHNLAGADLPLIVVPESDGVKEQQAWHDLLTDLTSTPEHKFLVIDGTYNAMRFEGQAKIDEGAVLRGIRKLLELCDNGNCTILTLWHPSREGQKRGDNSGWSVAWQNAPRAILGLTPVRDEEGMVELKFEKRNHAKKGEPVILTFDGSVLLSQGGIADDGGKLYRACLRIALKKADAGRPLPNNRKVLSPVLKEIEQITGLRPPEKEVRRQLALAEERGELEYRKSDGHHLAGYHAPRSAPPTMDDQATGGITATV